MKLDLDQIDQDYKNSKGWRELGKWLFSIATFGFGALYLWRSTSIVKQGEIGLRCNQHGEMTLLPPGRHSNFPWENYPIPPQSLAEKIIRLGPYKIIRVETGFVAKTYLDGSLQVLEEGQHLLSSASHTFEGFIPIKQETKKMNPVTAYTNDNVGLTIHADVRYQIEDPKLAITLIDNLDQSLKDIAEINMAQVVGHHRLADFAPAAANIGQDAPKKDGLTSLISELTTQITDQLKKLGIKLLNIGITSWIINDKALAHELAEGAVIQSQTQSRMLSAQRAAEIKIVEAEADAKAIAIRASAESEAIRLKGDATLQVANKLKDNPEAFHMYARDQQTEMVQKANNPYLFFNTALAGTPISMTLPAPGLNR